MAEYIEREALFKFADAIEQDFLTRNERPVFDLDGIRYLAQQLPAADVVPVVLAEWKPYHDHFTERHIGWICTNCSGVQMDLSNGDTAYCPNCGARMDGE